MRKIISAISLLAIFAACDSEEKLMEYGPYEPSIDEITNTPHGGSYENVGYGQIFINDWSTLEYFALQDYTEVPAFQFNGSFTIDNPEMVDRLCLFPDLKKVNGVFKMDNVSISSLKGFGQLDSLKGLFQINKVRQLKDFSGLNNLSVLESGLFFDYMDSLQSFSGLQDVKITGGRVYVRRCGKIKDMKNFPNLDADLMGEEGLTEFTLSENVELLSLDGLESLTEVNGTVSIFKCYKMEQIDALKNLERINGDLLIHVNRALKNIDGLKGLKEVTGDIIFKQNNYQNDWDVSFLPKKPIYQ